MVSDFMLYPPASFSPAGINTYSSRKFADFYRLGEI